MAVIHVITPEYFPQRGGVGDYTRVVARGLADAGDDVHVWSAEGSQGQPRDRVSVHDDFGRFRGRDLARAGRALDQFAAPRRLLVQWVPHGFGYHAMNLPFCVWLWQRAQAGDDVELMVHEPYLAFWEGTWRQTAAAAVHRVMTIVLLRAASRVWFSIPSWEPLWKPYALGRKVPFAWLPIPSSLDAPEPSAVELVRKTCSPDGRSLVGHLGTYGALITPLLSTLLPQLLGRPTSPRVLLLGTGAQSFAAALLSERPDLLGGIHAASSLSDGDLAAHVAACDVMVQPYPDGISSRRTTAMAALALGVPLVTTRGRLSEDVWTDVGAVCLTPVGDPRAMAAQTFDLLDHPELRAELRTAGRKLYARLFDLRHTVGALRDVEKRKAA